MFVFLLFLNSTTLILIFYLFSPSYFLILHSNLFGFVFMILCCFLIFIGWTTVFHMDKQINRYYYNMYENSSKSVVLVNYDFFLLSHLSYIL